jgi:hypothetical protein
MRDAIRGEDKPNQVLRDISKGNSALIQILSTPQRQYGTGSDVVRLTTTKAQLLQELKCLITQDPFCLV